MTLTTSADLARKRCTPCEGGVPPLSQDQVTSLLAALPNWKLTDDGKRIRLRAPQTITAASFERFLQAFQLLVRIEPSGEEGPRANNPGLKTKS